MRIVLFAAMPVVALLAAHTSAAAQEAPSRADVMADAVAAQAHVSVEAMRAIAQAIDLHDRSLLPARRAAALMSLSGKLSTLANRNGTLRDLAGKADAGRQEKSIGKALDGAEEALSHGQLSQARAAYDGIAAMPLGLDQDAVALIATAISAAVDCAVLAQDFDGAETKSLAAGQHFLDLHDAGHAYVAYTDAAQLRQREGELYGTLAPLDRSIDLWRSRVLTAFPRDQYAQFWGWAQHQLGFALWHRAALLRGNEAVSMLKQSVDAYEAALTALDKTSSGEGWQQTESDLGTSLQSLSDLSTGKERDDYLARATDAFRLAMQSLPPDAPPIKRAAGQFNYGVALLTRGTGPAPKISAAMLHDALDAIVSATTVMTEAAYPVQWTMARANMALGFMMLASLEPGKRLAHLRAAEAALLEAQRGFTAMSDSAQVARMGAALTQVRAQLAAIRP